MEVREVFECFMEAMYEKYQKRVNKPGNTPEPWKDFSEDLLIDRLYEEIDELKAEITHYTSYSKDNADRIADELLDVANFCMFLWAKLRGV